MRIIRATAFVACLSALCLAGTAHAEVLQQGGAEILRRGLSQILRGLWTRKRGVAGVHGQERQVAVEELCERASCLRRGDPGRSEPPQKRSLDRKPARRSSLPSSVISTPALRQRLDHALVEC